MYEIWGNNKNQMVNQKQLKEKRNLTCSFSHVEFESTPIWIAESHGERRALLIQLGNRWSRPESVRFGP